MSSHFSFYICDDFNLLDMAGPLAALRAANRLLEQDFYTISYVSGGGGMIAGDGMVELATEPSTSVMDGTLVAVGGAIAPMLDPDNILAFQDAAARVASVASICTGTFLLAASGFLNNKRATTHWEFADRLRNDFPLITVKPDRIYIRDGDVWTSAGMAAGMDLTLARIELDHGSAIAKAVSRELVVYHRRPGGHSQFAVISELEPETDRIRRALTYARDNLAAPLSINQLAEEACLSVRQFARSFRKETGETPARAIERLRCEAARLRLRDGGETILGVAQAVGFADAERMRRAFARTYGNSPQTQRQIDRDLHLAGNTASRSRERPQIVI